MKSMFVSCYKPFVHAANAVAEPHRLIVDPNDVPDSEHLVKIGHFESAPSPVRAQSTLAEEQTSCPIIRSGTAPESDLVIDAAALLRRRDIFWVTSRHNLAATNANVIALDTNALYETGYAWAGQIGELQQYKRSLKTTARFVSQTLQSLASDELIMTADGALQPINLELASTQPNVSAPLALRTLSTQYSTAVLDALNTWFCEFRVVARYALNWIDELFGCVARVLSVAFKSVSSPVRFFCSVRWERRRWFLYHGTRPPRPTVQAIVDLFTVACSRPPLAH
jgi:hypothetical protein